MFSTLLCLICSLRVSAMRLQSREDSIGILMSAANLTNSPQIPFQGLGQVADDLRKNGLSATQKKSALDMKRAMESKIDFDPIREVLHIAHQTAPSFSLLETAHASGSMADVQSHMADWVARIQTGLNNDTMFSSAKREGLLNAFFTYNTRFRLVIRQKYGLFFELRLNLLAFDHSAGGVAFNGALSLPKGGFGAIVTVINTVRAGYRHCDDRPGRGNIARGVYLNTYTYGSAGLSSGLGYAQEAGSCSDPERRDVQIQFGVFQQMGNAGVELINAGTHFPDGFALKVNFMWTKELRGNALINIRPVISWCLFYILKQTLSDGIKAKFEVAAWSDLSRNLELVETWWIPQGFGVELHPEWKGSARPDFYKAIFDRFGQFVEA